MSKLPQRYGFLLLPRFSLLSLASASEVLRVANDLLGGSSHEVLLLSLDGRAVTAAGGELLAVSGALEHAPTLAGIFVVADGMPAGAEASLVAIRSALSRVEQARGVLGGIGTGTAWLAYAGLLQGFRCTLPALHATRLSAAFPDVIVSTLLYEIDRNRLSCPGGSSALDLMICWLGQQHGERLTRQLLSHFGCERLRESQERQLLPTAVRLSASSKLSEAVALMESNLSEPLTTEEIASLVGVSRRQLERLFKQHLDTLPSRWYLDQRMISARRLLQQTSQSILQIGLSCGFSSGAHFSNAYRQCFERTPRDERSARAAAWHAATAAVEPTGVNSLAGEPHYTHTDSQQDRT